MASRQGGGENMRDKRNSLVLGGGLILVGLYLLARSLGVALPGWDAVWPLLLPGGRPIEPGAGSGAGPA